MKKKTTEKSEERLRQKGRLRVEKMASLYKRKALSTLDDNNDNDEDNDYLVYFIAIYVNDYLFLFSPQQIKQKKLVALFSIFCLPHFCILWSQNMVT